MLTPVYVELQQGASPTSEETEGYLSAVCEGTEDAQLLHVPAPCSGHAQHKRRSGFERPQRAQKLIDLVQLAARQPLYQWATSLYSIFAMR